MSDEFKDRQDVERAIRAQRLMDDEMLQEAFAVLEAEYVEFWKGSAAIDATGREKLWQAVQIVGKVKSHLNHVLASGRLAAASLNALTK